MTQAQDADAAQSEPVYSYKPSLLGAPWEFRLTPAALAWAVGRRSGRVPYRQIQAVRLSFRPATMQSHRFLAEIWPEQGPKLTIASTSWRSMVEQERQDAAYHAFVCELHRRIVAAGPQGQFISGAAPHLYWPGLAVFAVAAFGLAGLTVRALQTAQWAAAAFVGGFFALFLWQLGGYFRRNRPGRYRPEALPAELLPRP